MVEMTGVSFSYGRRTVFEGVDLVLEPGNIYGLLGLNGAGKSTLLRILSGLLFPDSGRVRILGQEPARRDPGFLSSIFMLSEALHLPGIRDREYISGLAPFYPNFDQALLERLLCELEVPRRQKLSTLSLGERKKFHLAFGLACQTSLLILDEPSNGLDIPSKSLFRRLLAETLTEERILIIATHQAKDVETLIDRILVLHEGHVILHRSVPEVSAGLRFSLEATPPDRTSAGPLHMEQVLGGFACVWARANAGDGHLDLELLFKAAIKNPGIFAQLFPME